MQITVTRTPLDGIELQYKQTGFYTPSAETIIAWNDPEIGISWPLADPILSDRDRGAISLKEYRLRPAFRSEVAHA